MEYRSQKILSQMTNFWETMLLLTLKRQDNVQCFKTDRQGLNPVPNLDPEPEKKPKLFQSQEIKTGFGTAINRYGSTTLLLSTDANLVPTCMYRTHDEISG
jgi:hypothetical protein